MQKQSQSYELGIKLVFAGKHRAGKTSLLTRQALNQFTQKWVATIGFDFRRKMYKVGNVQAKVTLWDTAAGQQRFRCIQKPYFKDAHAVLLCFNLGDRNSFENLQEQIEQIRALDLNICKIYLIGCKSDLQPQVFTDQILVFSQKHKCSYFQTSARQNQGVNECFSIIVNQCVQGQLQKLAFSKNENILFLQSNVNALAKRKFC